MAELTVREGAMELLQALLIGISTDEALAGEVAKVADAVERAGNFGEAEAMRVIARNHRIRALEARGQLAALQDRLDGAYEDPS